MSENNNKEKVAVCEHTQTKDLKAYQITEAHTSIKQACISCSSIRFVFKGGYTAEGKWHVPRFKK